MQLQRAPYIESGLATMNEAASSVIITADDAAQAAEAAIKLGGQVTNYLWLIDAVAATIPSNRIASLADAPGVRSVVQNRDVRSSSLECDDSVGPAACQGNRPGWVTERRKIKRESVLPAAQRSPIVKLPDGRLVAVAESGSVTYLTGDGSLMQKVSGLPAEYPGWMIQRQTSDRG